MRLYYVAGCFFDLCLRISDNPPNCVPFLALILCSSFEMRRTYALAGICIYMTLVNVLLWFIRDYPIIGWWSVFQLMSYMLNILIGNLMSAIVLFPPCKRGISCAGISMLSTLQFFLITNFGVWLSGNMYPLTFRGLVERYEMGIPFVRWQMLTDVGFLLLILSYYTNDIKHEYVPLV